eukprot:1616489-Karenia_brevis.AAC.1
MEMGNRNNSSHFDDWQNISGLNMQTTGTETDAEMPNGLGVGASGHAAPFPQTVYATTDSQTDYYDSGTDSDTVSSI